MSRLDILDEIKKEYYDKVNPNTDRKYPRIVVGMATCGIAAGAKPVLDAMLSEVYKQELDEKVVVSKTGCIGICQLEPVVEVYMPGETKVTYVKVTPTMGRKIIQEHILNNNIIQEYTMQVVCDKVLNDYILLGGQ